MKLFLLGLFLLLGFPFGLYLLLGKSALEDPNIVMGTVGVAVVLFAMACICTIKNVLSVVVDFLLVTAGAFLLLIAAFAKPLGLLDDPAGQEIEQRVMQHAKGVDGKDENGEAISQKQPESTQNQQIETIDSVLNNLDKPEAAEGSTVGNPNAQDTQTDGEGATHVAGNNDATQNAENSQEPKEGLELHSEEPRIVEPDTNEAVPEPESDIESEPVIVEPE